MESWVTRTLDFSNYQRQADSVAILVNEFGVCDISLGFGPVSKSLSANTDGCRSGDFKVAEYKITIVPELPLIGFHAMVDDTESTNGIVKLGLIIVDQISPDCIINYPDEDVSVLDRMEPLATAELVEGSISEVEKKRAELVEAVLRQDQVSIAQSQKDLLTQKLKLLIAAEPISSSEVGRDDFKAIFDRLKRYHGEGSDFDLSDNVVDELYDDMINDGLSYVGNNKFERSP